MAEPRDHNETDETGDERSDSDHFRHGVSSSHRGEDHAINATIRLERVLTGGEETIHVRRPVACQACEGSGAQQGTKPRICATCSGSGYLVESERQGFVSLPQSSICSHCGGRGSLVDTPCPDCGGKGHIPRDEVLTVQIPVGVEEQATLRVPGHGLPSDRPGCPPGDLLVIVRTAVDPRFERDGRELFHTEMLDVVDAVLGTDVAVSTLEGPTTLTIPPGTQPETVLRLPGEGLPRFGGGGRGDLYVRVKVRVPEHLSDIERYLFEQLRQVRIAMSRSHDHETTRSA
jgi:molecular chaperone DnaJ